jgi:hypothetical protein
MDETPMYQKAASNMGTPAVLKCRAMGAPSISFMWEREGEKLASGDRYSIRIQKVLHYY